MRLAILLATYNGQKHLDSQLDSVGRQHVAEIDVRASDDGSTDGTLDLLADRARRWDKGRFVVVRGPARGFQENFRSLVLGADESADYAAFCDQDDIWHDDKVAQAVAWLEAPDLPEPRLFCSSTRTMTGDGQFNGTSPIFRKPPSFENALVQSIAGANTMVMNRAALALLRESMRRTGFVSHDWWAYMIVTGAGGTVHYSPEPLVDYRQHGGNLVGENNSRAARFERLRMMLGGRFRSWSDLNIAGLEACRNLLTPAAAASLDAFKAARAGSPLTRLAALRRSGAYRQTTFGQLGLYVASALGKI